MYSTLSYCLNAFLDNLACRCFPYHSSFPSLSYKRLKSNKEYETSRNITYTARYQLLPSLILFWSQPRSASFSFPSPSPPSFLSLRLHHIKHYWLFLPALDGSCIVSRHYLLLETFLFARVLRWRRPRTRRRSSASDCDGWRTLGLRWNEFVMVLCRFMVFFPPCFFWGDYLAVCLCFSVSCLPFLTCGSGNLWAREQNLREKWVCVSRCW